MIITDCVYGELKVVFQPPVITKKVVKRKFWFSKIEYWVEWEFVASGPYKSHADAYEFYRLCPH